MNPIAFLYRSIGLSFVVALYWLPVLIITAYAFSTIMDLMRNQLLGLIILVVLFFQPIIVALSILCIRGALMALKATKGTDFGRLAGVLWRVLRFNVPLMVTIITLFGLSTMLTGMAFMDSDYFQNIMNARTADPSIQGATIISAVLEFPLILGTGWVFGFCVAVAAMGVSVAAASAMAVDKPPNHHQLWGIGGEFANILTVALIVIFLPYLFLVALATFGTLALLLSYSSILLWGIGIFLLWSLCVLAAAIALGYSLTVEKSEIQRKRDMEEMAGLASEGVQKVDLKQLRQARMGGQIAPISAGIVDDDEEEDGEYYEDDEEYDEEGDYEQDYEDPDERP